MPLTIPTIYTAVDKFSGPVHRMVAANQKFVSSVETGVARSERFYRKLTPALGETTKQMFSFVSAAAIAAAVLGTITFSFGQVKQFDKELGLLRSITGQTREQFEPIRQKVIEVAKDAKKSSVETVEAFEKIAALNAKFLETADAIGAVSAATILMAKASGDELGPSAEALVGIMNQFSFAADQANRTVNVLAAGAGVGAASIINVSEAFKNFGSVAAGSNITLEESVGLIEVLGKFSVLGAEAGTKLRGVILQLQKNGIGYASGQFKINDALAEAVVRMNKLRTAKQKDAFLNKLFGAENVSTGRIVLGNIPLFNEFTKAVTGTIEATKQAGINTDTLGATLDTVSAAWINVITGSDKTTTAMNGVKTAARFVADHMDTIVSIGIKVIGVFIAWKALLIATRTAIVLYNVALGVTGALSATASVAIGANAVALAAYKVTAGLATAAQWALNIALDANPIGVVILAIAALIGVTVAVTKNWNDWGAAITLFLGPLGTVISLVQALRRNWEGITQAFSHEGILGGIKKLGMVLLDVFIMPLQQAMKLIASLTGAKWASNAAMGMELIRQKLGVNTATDESGNALPEYPLVSPRLEEQKSLKETINTNKQNVAINIKDDTGRASMTSDNDMVPVKLSSTMGFSR